MTHLEQTASPGTERGMPTPGPWSCQPANGPHVAQVYDNNGHTVAFMSALNPFSDDNARLIAAAPTMLEALRTAKDELYHIAHSSCDPDSPDAMDSIACAYRECRDAIALAEGRTPTETKGGASDERPAQCRFRLQDEAKPYPRSGCTACGKTITTGLGTHCTATPRTHQAGALP